MSDGRVLALSMRPKCFADMVGQEHMLSILESQWRSGRIPHFFIIAGPIGIGKTTLARLIALSLQCPGVDPFDPKVELQWNRRFDIREINAANRNGIDDIRGIIESMRHVPMAPSVAKVVIMDEAHQLTGAAQNALLTETEDVARHVYYVFCTSHLTKLLPALRRRAYILTPATLDKDAIAELLKKARGRHGGTGVPLEPLLDALLAQDVSSPGVVLQAAEKYFAGSSALESATLSCQNPKVDTMALCRAIAKGDWAGAAPLLKDVGKTDVFPLRACILGYLRTVLLNASGARAGWVAKAIAALCEVSIDDNVILPSFLAACCTACGRLSAKPLA